MDPLPSLLRFVRTACVAAATFASCLPITTALESSPVVKFIYFVPSNIAFDPKAYAAVQSAASDYIAWNRGQFGGTAPNYKFDYVQGDHTWEWYIYSRGEYNRMGSKSLKTHQPYYAIYVTQAEVVRKLQEDPKKDPNLKHVVFMHEYASEEDAYPQSAEFAYSWISYQYVELMQTDRALPRLVIAHELGHVWGLIHEGPYEDCMQGGWYLTGMCDYSPANRQKILTTSRNFVAGQPGTNLGVRPAPPACATSMYQSCAGTNGTRSCCPPEGYCQPVGTEATCIPRPTKCTDQLTDTDYYGNDIKSVQVATNGECCEQCSQTPGCQAYTYFWSEAPGIPKGSCYLKSLAGQPTKVVGAVSGVILQDWSTAPCPTQIGGSCAKQANGIRGCCPAGSFCQPLGGSTYQCTKNPPKCGLQVPEQEYNGHQIALVNATSVDECCDACSQTAGCKAYTYYKDASPPAPKGACYLRSAVGLLIQKSAAISGTQVTPNVCPAKIGDSCAGSNGVRSCCPYDGYCQPMLDGSYKCAKRSPKCAPQLTDKDFYGNDLKSVKASSADDCCAQCVATPGCKAYTHIGINNGDAGSCYLKTAAGTTTTYVGAVAGTIF